MQIREIMIDFAQISTNVHIFFII